MLPERNEERVIRGRASPAFRGTYAFFNLPGLRTSIEAFTVKTGGVS
jgi:hypothetical protein